MVGARFRWNEAKSRRRLLLIRAWGGERLRRGQPLAADGVGAVAPVASGSASSLVAPPPLWMLRPDGDVGCCGAVGPRAALWRCRARAAQDFTSA